MLLWESDLGMPTVTGNVREDGLLTVQQRWRASPARTVSCQVLHSGTAYGMARADRALVVG